MSNRFVKYLCCIDLTLATKIIAAIGIAIGVVLSVALIHETTNEEKYYSGCKKIALALGLDLDWFHINSNSSTSYVLQERVTITVITAYSIIYLITNMLLLLSTILMNKLFTIPWLICELLQCTSKLAGLVYHLIKQRNQTNTVYITGSVIYISLMLWWMLVVFFAQKSWLYQVKLHLTIRPLKISTSKQRITPKMYNFDEFSMNESFLESTPNYNNQRAET